MTTWIAVADANYPTGATNLESNFIGCGWHRQTARIENFQGDNRDIFPVGRNPCAIGAKPWPC